MIVSITGATGFVGSRLVKKLVEGKHKINASTQLMRVLMLVKGGSKMFYNWRLGVTFYLQHNTIEYTDALHMV